jgi:hypothetical protein
MMSDDEEKTCAHPACDCEANEESDYCSNACAESDSEGRCHCKHSGCGGRHLPAIPQKNVTRTFKKKA